MPMFGELFTGTGKAPGNKLGAIVSSSSFLLADQKRRPVVHKREAHLGMSFENVARTKSSQSSIHLPYLIQYSKHLFRDFLAFNGEPHAASFLPTSTVEDWPDRRGKNATSPLAQELSG